MPELEIARVFLVAILLLAFGLFVVAGLSSADVAALAIYIADVNSSDNLADSLVNYNITSASLIDSILSGIEFDVQLDCTGLESKNSAYMYVKFKDGSRKVYDLFLENSHIAIRERRDLCFFVDPASRSLILANAQ